MRLLLHLLCPSTTEDAMGMRDLGMPSPALVIAIVGLRITGAAAGQAGGGYRAAAAKRPKVRQRRRGSRGRGWRASSLAHRP